MSSKTASTPKYKLDLWNQVLPEMDRKNYGYFDSLSEEDRKGFMPPVALRAMSVVAGNNAEYHIMMVNERANLGFWDIHQHPELQYRLLASCGAGRPQPHKWVANAKAGKKTDAVTNFLRKFWPDANDREISIILKQHTYDSFQDFVLHSGSTPDEEKEVLEAYDRLVGREKGPSKKKSKGR